MHSESFMTSSVQHRGPSPRGRVEKPFVLPDYVSHLLSYVDLPSLKGMKVVTNAGNGGAGLVVDALECTPMLYSRLTGSTMWNSLVYTDRRSGTTHRFQHGNCVQDLPWQR